MNSKRTTRPSRYPAIVFLGTLLLLALALAGCGGGGSAPPPAQNQNPRPTLTSLSPTSVNAGDPEFTLTANGSSFIATSKVRWNGADRTTTFVSSTQLTATIPASDVAAGGTVNVTVFNPTPGGGTSTAATFTINNPAPTLTSISPNSASAGATDITLTVTGTNFVPGSMVRWNGEDRTTTFSSATQLSATIPASDLAAGGTAQVTVFNPAPSGGLTDPLPFTINNPAPTITSISPLSALAGTAGFSLTVNGTGFVTTSVVRWKGIDRPTTFLSATQLAADISAADIAIAGAVQVTVFNPAPAGGLSAASTFTVTAAPAVIVKTTQLPATGSGKEYDFTLEATGGITPYTWSISSGALPGGLTLDATTGRIAGTVPTVGSDTPFNFTVRAADSATVPTTATRLLSMLVRAAGNLGRNDACTANSTAGTTQISNGRIRATISPYGDIDVYSFQGTAGQQVTIEIFAERLDLDGNPFNRDSWLDSVLELLDNTCPNASLNGTNALAFDDDIITGELQDSHIENFTLPYTGLYFIRVRDFRGDGRPDFVYELTLSGAD